MEAFQQRVVDEETELNAKIEKLTAFLHGETFDGLPLVERARLSQQLTYMLSYSAVLHERIDAFTRKEL